MKNETRIKIEAIQEQLDSKYKITGNNSTHTIPITTVVPELIMQYYLKHILQSGIKIIL